MLSWGLGRSLEECFLSHGVRLISLRMSKRSYNLLASLILFGSLALSGCSKPEDKLVGTWGIDLDATMANDEKLKAMPPEQQKMAKDMAAGLFKDTNFEFTKDGKMKANFAGKQEEATYAVKSSEGDKFVLSTKDKSGKDQDVTVEVHDKQMTITTNGQKLILAKK